MPALRIPNQERVNIINIFIRPPPLLWQHLPPRQGGSRSKSDKNNKCAGEPDTITRCCVSLCSKNPTLGARVRCIQRQPLETPRATVAFVREAHYSHLPFYGNAFHQGRGLPALALQTRRRRVDQHCTLDL